LYPSVSVLVLNFKQAPYVPHCLEALRRQSYPATEIIFSDNGSQDGSVDFVRAHYPEVRVITHDANLYYCKAHNIAIQQSTGEYVLTLNVDVKVTETFIAQMARTMKLDPRVGMVSGKLLQMDRDLRPVSPPTIDSTGMWFSPETRHFDRGWGEPDGGQYDRMEYVFGPSGAAALYRRAMLQDVAFEGEYLDEDFVIYREDADLAWRAQWLGWKGLYTPYAVAFHVRRLHHRSNRRANDPELNMHSVKNRFLMRMKNQSAAQAVRFLAPTLWRDCQVVGYAALVERSSLPGLARAARLLPRMLAKRRDLLRRKRVSDRYMAGWFSYHPQALPFPGAGESCS
jgi:GT2 family glycosyltransferase